MQKREDGYLIEFDEYNYIFNVIFSMRDNNVASKHDIERALEEKEFTPEFLKHSYNAEMRTMANIFYMDIIKNIFGSEDFLKSSTGPYDVVGFVELYVEQVNKVLSSMSFKTFEVRTKFSGRRELIFNEYKFRCVILHLIELALYGSRSKNGVIYLSDDGDDGDEFMTISVAASERFEDKTLDDSTLAEAVDDLRGITDLRLRRAGGLVVLNRFAKDLGGELCRTLYRGDARYAVKMAKKFSGNRLNDVKRNPQFSILEIRRFFEMLKAAEDADGAVTGSDGENKR